MPIFIEDGKVLFHGLRPYGMEWCFGVSKNCAVPEKAFQLIDYLFSYNGMMTLTNGPQGIVWDYDENGNPYVTTNGWYIINNNLDIGSGGKLADGISWINVEGLDKKTIHPDTGLPLSYSYWPRKADAPNLSRLELDWQAATGAVDQVDWLNKQDGIAVKQFTPLRSVTDEIEQLNARIGDMMTEMTWKCVFATDEAEFNALLDKMIDEAYAMGLQESLDYTTESYQLAKEASTKYLSPLNASSSAILSLSFEGVD